MKRLFLALWFVCVPVALHADDSGNAQTILNLLDYVAVEYPSFVRNGAVLDAAEYEEQVEFSGRVADMVQTLPELPARAGLLSNATELRRLIAEKGDGAKVVALAQEIQRGLIDAYKIAVAPKQAPELESAAALYLDNCVACHGSTGDGAGPQAAGLEPPPSNFTDRERAAARSVYGLFNTISLGVDGTSMSPFKHLSADDRWKLAFYVSQFSASEAERKQGKLQWQEGTGRSLLDGLRALVLTTPEQARQHGAADVLAYLRAEPAAVMASVDSPLAFSIATMRLSHDAWLAGRVEDAYDLAVTAYLEGFELAEPTLNNIDPALRTRVEQAMMAYRNAVKSGQADAEVQSRYDAAQHLLRESQQRIGAGGGSSATYLISALIIILREGLEAILVLAAMGAFLVRTERREGLPWLHAGWITALAAGALTWVVSSRLISISGAQREVTEGVTALISSAVLLYVGFWLHSKASAAKWSAFIRGKMSGATSGGTWFGVALVAFLAVYREVFETVLFYQALWVQSSGSARGAVIAGFGLGIVGLVVLAWLIIRLSVRLPLGLFFGASSALLAVMAVVFAGQGIAALQEAGKLPLSPVNVPAVPLLGIYPSAQGLVLQLVLVGLILAGSLLVRANARRV